MTSGFTDSTSAPLYQGDSDGLPGHTKPFLFCANVNFSKTLHYTPSGLLIFHDFFMSLATLWVSVRDGIRQARYCFRKSLSFYKSPEIPANLINRRPRLRLPDRQHEHVVKIMFAVAVAFVSKRNPVLRKTPRHVRRLILKEIPDGSIKEHRRIILRHVKIR